MLIGVQGDSVTSPGVNQDGVRSLKLGISAPTICTDVVRRGAAVDDVLTEPETESN